MWHPHLKKVKISNQIAIEDHLNKVYPVQLVQLTSKLVSKSKLAPKQNCNCKFLNTIIQSTINSSNSLIQKKSLETKLVEIKDSKLQNKFQSNINSKIVSNNNSTLLPNHENINNLQYGTNGRNILPIFANYQIPYSNTYYPNNYQLARYNYQDMIKRNLLRDLLFNGVANQQYVPNQIQYPNNFLPAF